MNNNAKQLMLGEKMCSFDVHAHEIYRKVTLLNVNTKGNPYLTPTYEISVYIFIICTRFTIIHLLLLRSALLYRFYSNKEDQYWINPSLAYEKENPKTHILIVSIEFLFIPKSKPPILPLSCVRSFLIILTAAVKYKKRAHQTRIRASKLWLAPKNVYKTWVQCAWYCRRQKQHTHETHIAGR